MKWFVLKISAGCHFLSLLSSIWILQTLKTTLWPEGNFCSLWWLSKNIKLMIFSKRLELWKESFEKDIEQWSHDSLFDFTGANLIAFQKLLCFIFQYTIVFIFFFLGKMKLFPTGSHGWGLFSLTPKLYSTRSRIFRLKSMKEEVERTGSVTDKQFDRWSSLLLKLMIRFVWFDLECWLVELWRVFEQISKHKFPGIQPTTLIIDNAICTITTNNINHSLVNGINNCYLLELRESMPNTIDNCSCYSTDRDSILIN